MTPEQGKKIVLVTEKAQVELKKILNAAMLVPQMTRRDVKALVDALIKQVRDELEELDAEPVMIEETILGIQETFLTQYSLIVEYFKREAKKNEKNKKFLTVKWIALSSKDGSGYDAKSLVIGDSEDVKDISKLNLRDFMTEYDEASEGYYINYPEAVRNTMNEMTNKIAGASVEFNHTSIRSSAELSVRYNLIQEDLKRIGEKGFVVATQHANASERCSWWQGKLFIIDFDVEARQMSEYPGKEVVKPLVKPIGKIDGKPYYSLKTACENGFLSYNCQHRLVKYEKGMHMPTPLSANLVSKRRDISQKQRYLERCIRQAKTDELVLVGLEDRKKAVEKSKKYQKMYKDFCKSNNVPMYQWRTQVTF